MACVNYIRFALKLVFHAPIFTRDLHLNEILIGNRNMGPIKLVYLVNAAEFELHVLQCSQIVILIGYLIRL